MSMPVLASVLLGCVGLFIGYTAQRSRMCFIAGVRDFILVRDRELLYGFFSFFLTVWLLTSVLYSFGMLERGVPEYQSVKDLSKVEERAMKLSAEAMEGEGTAGEITILGGTKETGGVRRGVVNPFMGATVVGGLIMGLLSVFAGGCVLRQHVLAAQGQRNSLFFIIGFYAGSVAFYTVLYQFFDWIY